MFFTASKLKLRLNTGSHYEFLCVSHCDKAALHPNHHRFRIEDQEVLDSNEFLQSNTSMKCYESIGHIVCKLCCDLFIIIWFEFTSTKLTDIQCECRATILRLQSIQWNNVAWYNQTICSSHFGLISDAFNRSNYSLSGCAFIIIITAFQLF